MAESRTQRALRVLLSPYQPLLHAALACLTERNINTARGVHLDAIGKLVGRPRNGETDDEVYRRYCRAQISANKSDGTIEDILKVARLVIDDPAASIQLDNVGRAAYILRVEGIALPGVRAATLRTLDLPMPVTTDGAPWDATLTWSETGLAGNDGVLALDFVNGNPHSVEVRDDERSVGGVWEAAPGTIGVLVTGDNADPCPVSEIESTINAGSGLAQVTTPDETGALVDHDVMDAVQTSAQFTNGLDGPRVATPLVELVLKATAAGVRAFIGYSLDEPANVLRWGSSGTWGSSVWSHLVNRKES